MRGDGLLTCSRKCIELQVSCPMNNCKHWIDYPHDNNCSLIAIKEQGPMTLRQIAERLHLSFARIKQIETKALSKIKKHAASLNSFF
tara:strand:- start:195 stop:455 length:261 start_codon:yes stop_codon:yes gene_type:complete